MQLNIDENNNPLALHRYSYFKNTTRHWLDLDNYDTWSAHMLDPTKRSILQANGWDHEQAITYTLNGQGFRSDDFTDEPGIITLGCSFTFGIGLPNNVIWPTIVAQTLGLKSWNLGIGSASIDVCFRLLEYYISKLNTRAVILLKPEPARFELFNHDSTSTWVVPSQHYTENVNHYRKIWYENELNYILNYKKTTMAVHHVCAINRVKLIEKEIQLDLIKNILYPGNSWARDLQHPGILHHKILAQTVLKDLDSNKNE